MRDVILLADTLASLPQHLDLFIAHKQHILLCFFNLLFFPSFKFRPYHKGPHSSSGMTLSPPTHHYQALLCFRIATHLVYALRSALSLCLSGQNSLYFPAPNFQLTSRYNPMPTKVDASKPVPAILALKPPRVPAFFANLCCCSSN